MRRTFFHVALLCICLICIGLTRLFCESAVARSRSAERPEIAFKAGEPIRARWSDGRQAVFMDQIDEAEPFKVPALFSGSTCAKTPAPRCRFVSPIRFRKLFFVWEKHPLDPAREGKILERLNVDTLEPEGLLAHHMLVTQDTQTIWRRLGLKNALKEKLMIALHCDRFEWLPASATGESDRHVVVPTWITNFEDPVKEFDIPGVEDNSAINQFTSVARYSTFLWQAPTSYLVKEMETFTTTVLHHGTILRGYVTSLQFDRRQYARHPGRIETQLSKPENAACSVDFTLSFADFFAQNNARHSQPVTPDYDRARSRFVLYDRRDPQVHLDAGMFALEGTYR